MQSERVVELGDQVAGASADHRVQLLGLGQRGLAYRTAVSEFESFSAERYRTRLSSSDIVEIITALKK